MVEKRLKTYDDFGGEKWEGPFQHVLPKPIIDVGFGASPKLVKKKQVSN
jgi:hypothetical protein